jgi:hypothetical protein
VGIINERTAGMNSPCVEGSSFLHDADLNHKSFAGLWYSSQSPK